MVQPILFGIFVFCSEIFYLSNVSRSEEKPKINSALRILILNYFFFAFRYQPQLSAAYSTATV